MRKERSILIFPEFGDEKIQELRKQYDPLWEKIPPHLTLVFPFVSELTEKQLSHHIEKVLGNFSTFTVTLSGLSFETDGYIYLNVTEGAAEIREFHDQLYQGILTPFLHPSLSYIPHVTVGRYLENEERDIRTRLADFEDEFTFQVHQIVMEEIQADESSKIIHEYKLTAGSSLKT